MEKKNKMKKQKLSDPFISIVCIGLFIVVIFFVFNTVYYEGYLGKKQVCKETYDSIILSIKDMKISSGFLSSSNRCIYGTTKGDIVTVCIYDVGDKVNKQTICRYE